MDNQPARSYTKLTIVLLVTALVIGASIIVSAYERTNSTTSTPFSSTTSVSDWKFSVQLNPTVVTVGQQITFTCQLTSISSQNQTVILASQVSYPAIYTQGGKLVWAYEPSSTSGIQVVPAGEVMSEQINVPTSGLQEGQTYILSSAPSIYTDSSPEVSIGQNLQVNATIQVVSG